MDDKKLHDESIRRAKAVAYDPTIVNPQLQYKRMPSEEGIVAKVNSKKPNTVQVGNVETFLGKGEYGPLHEAEHTYGMRANQFGKSRDDMAVGIMQKNFGFGPKESISTLRAFMHKANKPEIGEYIEKKYGVKPVYLGSGRDDIVSFEEMLADLSAIETAKKVDLTRDPFIRERLFKTYGKGGSDEYAPLTQTYKAITGTRTTRLDAKDPEPFVPTTTEEESFFDRIRSKLGFKYGGKVTMPTGYKKGGNVSLI